MNNKTYWTWNSSEGQKKIHYIENGDGPNHIVLIHGYGSHTCTWYDLLNPLIKAGYKVWAIDLLGFGYSDKPLNASYGLQLYLEQIRAFMKEKQIPQADLIAHSMGGTVALGLAIHHPNQVKSLTLISAMAYPFKLPLGFRIAKTFPSLIKLFCGLSFIKAMRKQLVIKTETSCTPQKVSEAAEPYFLHNGPDAAFHILGKFNNQVLIDISSQYKQIKKASMIIWGKNDPLIPSDHAKFFNRDMPHADICLLDHCGHIPHEEYPQEVEQVILQFLKNSVR